MTTPAIEMTGTSIVPMTPEMTGMTIVNPPNVSLLPTAHEYRVLLDLADKFVESGFLPTSIKTSAQALAIMLTGKELGIPPMLALRQIHVIEGKPTLAAELQLALFRRRGGRFKWVTTTAKMAVLDVAAPGEQLDDASQFSFTIEEAEAAGLLGKGNWRKYPAAMLRARVAALAIRAVAPEVSMGLYDPDELGGETNEAGEIEHWPEAKSFSANYGHEKPTTPKPVPGTPEAVARFHGISGQQPPVQEQPVDSDPVLPIEPYLSKGIRLSDPKCLLGGVLKFLWTCISKDQTDRYASLMAKAYSVSGLKLQDATYAHLTDVRKWIVGDEKREKLFAAVLTQVESRMDDLNAMATELDNKPKEGVTPAPGMTDLMVTPESITDEMVAGSADDDLIGMLDEQQ